MAKRKLDQYRGKLSPTQIAEGINAALSNAKRLTEDAELLLQGARYASALTLAILAIEEAGKSAILRKLAVAQVNDKERAKCWRAYRNHRKKNAGWLLPKLIEEGASKLDDFRILVREDADHSLLLDYLKQINLYSECYGTGQWSMPADLAGEKDARTFIRIARGFLRDSEVTVEEIELWIKHLARFYAPNASHSYDEVKQVFFALNADMQQHGLTAPGDEEMILLMFPEGRD